MSRFLKILTTIMDNEERVLIVINNKDIELANKAFLKFYKVKSIEEFKQKYGVPCKTMKVNKEPLKVNCKDDKFFEYMQSLKDKEIEINGFYFQLDVFKVDDNSFVVTLTDITGIYNDYKKFDKLANYDQLTGIYNRYKLQDLFSIKSKFANRYNTPLSCIMFDIDNFKMVNDTFGHDIGDEVLKNLAKIVSNTIRETDIFARWGGEEFVILLPNTNINETIKIAEKIRIAVEEYNFHKVGQVTISLGVSEYQKGDSLEKCVKKSDIALYTAKEKGKNRVEVFKN